MYYQYNKYRNQKTIIDGYKFASKKEANRYLELSLMRKAGIIKNLTLQPRYTLLEAFVAQDGIKYRGIKYIADFAYFDIEKNRNVVEDVKGMLTDVYKIKKKLFLSKYPDLHFQEI